MPIENRENFIYQSRMTYKGRFKLEVYQLILLI